MYWRRRIVALAAGLSVLAVISWAFNGAIGGGSPARPSAASNKPAARSNAGQQQDVGGSGIGNSGAGNRGGPVAAQPGGADSATTSASPGASTPTSKVPAGCPHGNVVLSLFSAQQSYGAGQLPQFTVDVVGTAHQTCSFNVGASHIALIIRSGTTQVWSSADCVQGAGDLVTDLQRGVPTVLPISWNRQPSSPGCQAESAPVPPGTYTATASDGWLDSNTVTFHIS